MGSRRQKSFQILFCILALKPLVKKIPPLITKIFAPWIPLLLKKISIAAKGKNPAKLVNRKIIVSLLLHYTLYFQRTCFSIICSSFRKKNLKKQIKLYSCISFYYNPSLITFQWEWIFRPAYLACAKFLPGKENRKNHWKGSTEKQLHTHWRFSALVLWLITISASIPVVMLIFNN